MSVWVTNDLVIHIVDRLVPVDQQDWSRLEFLLLLTYWNEGSRSYVCPPEIRYDKFDFRKYWFEFWKDVDDNGVLR